MTRGGLPALAALEIADEPSVWHGLGFAVGPGGRFDVGGVELHAAGAAAGDGLCAWSLRAESALPRLVDGIPTQAAAPRPPGRAVEQTHPNGATAIDHVVVTTPDLPRTLAALEGVGMEVRRVREAGSAERPLHQAFLWAGDVLLEVAGPPEREGDGPARLWGVVIVVPSLEPLLSMGRPCVGDARDAVQPGRRIATVRREAGSSVPVAFMTPHGKAAQAGASARARA